MGTGSVEGGYVWSCRRLKTDVVQVASPTEGEVAEEGTIEMITDHLEAVVARWEAEQHPTKEEIPLMKVEVVGLAIVTRAQITVTILMTEAATQGEGGEEDEGGMTTIPLEEDGVVEGDNTGITREDVGHHVTMVVEITRVDMTRVTLIVPAVTALQGEEVPEGIPVEATETGAEDTEMTTPDLTTAREATMKMKTIDHPRDQ